MKNETRKEVIEKIENTLKLHNNIFVLMNEKNNISQKKTESENKMNDLIEKKYNELDQIEHNEKRLENYKIVSDKYEKDILKYNDNIILYDVIIKAYKKIINNGLYLLLNDIVYIMVYYCKNKRDQNEFLNLFNEYNKETKKYKYTFNIDFENGYSFNKYVNITYNRPDISSYNIYKNDLLLNYYIDVNNNIVYDEKYNHSKNMESIKNYADYLKPLNENNIFYHDNIKNNCKKLLKISNEQIEKQKKIIIECNEKIDNANIYNLDGFKKYSK